MLTFFQLSSSMILGAFGRRIAGGLWETWTNYKWGQPTRLFFGFTLALCAWISGAPFWISMILIPAVWVGTITGLFGGLGMGRNGVDRHPSFLAPIYWRDVGGLSIHGILSIILPTLWAWQFGYLMWPIILSGILIGPCYEIGYRIIGINPRPTPFNKMHWPKGFNSSTEYGEIMWGAIRGMGISLSVILI